MGHPEPLSRPRSTWAGTVLVLLSYLALSAAWSWPLARFDADVLVTRQFDMYATIWLIARAPFVSLGLLHPESAWPVGETLARADSYALLPLAWALGGRVDPRTVASLLAFLGPVAGAIATERCAAYAFRVPRPASWVAGVIYGFSGITGSALLEGHVYHAVNPWLPLLLWAAWRAQEDDGRWTHGFAAAAAWAGCLLTTAYAGVLGALLLVVIGLRGGVFRLVAGMLVIGLPVGRVYLAAFTAGGGWSAAPDATQALSMGSATLASLAGWSDTIDLRYHSIGAPVGWLGFGLLLLGPVVLRGRPAWRTLFGLALLSLLVALGRNVRIDPGAQAWWSPVSWLTGIPGIELFRFPVRVARLYALCAGIVGARVVQGLAERVGPALLGPLFLLVALDPIVSNGLPWRLKSQVATLPSAYTAAPEGRAVLDLWAQPIDRSSGELEMWSRALGCYYQAFHQRPVLEVCMGTRVDSPRERVDHWLSSELLRASPDTAAITTRLAMLGVGAVVLHADVYRPGDAALLTSVLTDTFGPPTESRDGGEHLLLWVVPALTEADPRAAWEAIRAGR